MKRWITIFLLALGLVGATGGVEESRQESKFINLDQGFAITKHPDWHFLSLDNAEVWMTASEDTEEERANLQKHIQSLREQESKTGMAPVFIAKHQEPYPDLNPMISITLHNIGDMPKDVSMLAIAATMAKNIPANNKGFKVVDRAQLVRVSNFDAGYMSFAVSGHLNSGEKTDAMSQVYLIQRGKYVFEITVSTPLKYDDATEADLEEMMETIFILKPFEI